ncbi:hypothetical protein ACLOJK_012245 [Asimina triloba]
MIGSFVVVDESGKDKALESGSKVACIVSQVLYYEQTNDANDALFSDQTELGKNRTEQQVREGANDD